MKAAIDVQSREEGEQIKAGLADPATKALVKVVGILLDLPDDRARQRTLRWVIDRANDVGTE